MTLHPIVHLLPRSYQAILKHYPKDCPVPDDQLLRDALEAVHLDFPDYQPCFDSEVNSFDTVISSKNSEFNLLKSDISHKMGQNKMVQTDGKNDLTDPVLTQQNIESTIMLSKSKDENIFQGPQKDTVQSTTNIMSTEVKDETLAKNYIEDFIKDSFHKAYQTTKRAITVLRPESIKSKDVEDGTNDGKKIEAITNYTFSKKKDLDLNSKVNEETTNDRNTEKFIGAIFNTVVSNLSVLSHHENLDNSDSSNQDVQDHNNVNKAIANEDVSSPETSGLSSGVFMLIKSKIASLLGGGEHEKKTTATTTIECGEQCRKPITKYIPEPPVKEENEKKADCQRCENEGIGSSKDGCDCFRVKDCCESQKRL
ncbi:hypothetical protein ACJJTC_005032 [Scirpophaga incertulas]